MKKKTIDRRIEHTQAVVTFIQKGCDIRNSQ